MSDAQNPGFGKFVPGFDFLQNLAKGATQTIPQMPNLANWVAPTLNVEELDKRIDELKAVHFWLEQNSRALGATVQALEVQKMTLVTLKGMNFNMGDVANALKLKATDTVASGMHKSTDTARSLADVAAAVTTPPAKKTPQAAPESPASGGVADPLQWWGALTQQFQHIAANAMQDAAKQAALDSTKQAAAGLAKKAVKNAVKKVAERAPATAVKKTSTRKRIP